MFWNARAGSFYSDPKIDWLDAYKEQFYARMNGELETAIQVRRVYLALYQGRHAARFDDSDPAATHVRLRFPRPANGRRWFEQTPYSLDSADAYSDGIRAGGIHPGSIRSGGREEAVQYPATEIEG